jgi:hypothetical protein
MEPALASGVSSSVDWNRLRRHWPWTLFAAAVLAFQLGSRVDRIVVLTIWLALVSLPVERYIHQLAAFMSRHVLTRYALLSTIALVWSWANARFRTGGGPLHIANAETWRGYPFMFEDWYWSQGGLSEITWHREFHWLGLIGDVLIPAAVFFFIIRWLRRSGAPIEGTRALLFVGFTALFTWLNIEPWLGGLPLTIAGPPPPFRPPAYYFSSGGLTLGFPLAFWNGFISELQFQRITIDVLIGLAAWSALYCARFAARRIRG